jgi:hypothetical protein
MLSMFAAPATTIAAAVSTRIRLAPITSNISPAVQAQSPKACSALKRSLALSTSSAPTTAPTPVQPSNSP